MGPRRSEITELEWSAIASLLPNKPRGVPRVDDSRVLDGIFWCLRTGSSWSDISERYGPPTTYNRFVRWRSLTCGIACFMQYRARMTAICRWSTVHRSVSISTLPTSKGGVRRRQPPLGTSLLPDAWGAHGRPRLITMVVRNTFQNMK